MGSESSVFQKFELGDPFDENEEIKEEKEGLKCTVFPAVRKKDGKPVTLLRLGKQKDQNDYSREEILIEVLKTIRHPNIIKFSGLVRSEKSCWLVTEESVPLSSIINSLEDDELICGLYDIMKSLIFLHSRCQMTYNNIKLSSIFVCAKDRTWKLGAMEKVSSIKKTPQLVQKDIKMFAKFAIFILDMLQEPDFAVASLSKKLDTFFLQSETNLSISDVEALLEEDVFRSSFMEISSFLEDITLKTSEEKDAFFKSLYSKVKKMNQEVLTKRLSHLFFSKLVLAEPAAEEFFLSYLFRYSGDSIKSATADCVFRGSGFRQYCVPIILNLFKSRDTHVRLMVLKFLPLCLDAFSTETLVNDILPEVLLGLKDMSDEVVAATFKGLSYLVPILGGDVVVGGERHKHFVDRKPKFNRPGYSSCSEDSCDTLNMKTPSPETNKENNKQLRILERRRQREIVREKWRKDKEKSPSKSTLGAEKIKKIEDFSMNGNGDSEPEWEEYEASPLGSDSENQEIETNSKERPTETVQPILKSEPQVTNNHFEECKTKSIDDELTIHLTSNKVDTEGRGGALVLKHTKLKISEKCDREVEKEVDDKDSWAESFDSTEDEQVIDNSITETTELPPTETVLPRNQNSSPSIAVQKNTQSKVTNKIWASDKLGAEFEVAVKITKQPEVDFFADMEPDFKTNTAPVLSTKNDVSAISAKFTVNEQQPSEEATGGWENDGWDDFT